jgi:hypothetical protein
MHNLNLCTLSIALEFGSVNGKLMQVLVEGEPVDPDSDLKALICLPIRLPTNIKIEFLNKDSSADTIVDSKGNIVQDLYVKFSEVRLDGFLLNEKYLHQKIILNTMNGDTINTSYIGFNGTVVLNFNHHTVFSQYLWSNQ